MTSLKTACLHDSLFSCKSMSVFSLCSQLILMFLNSFTVVISQSVHEVRWLPCQFIDERVVIVEELVLGKRTNLKETKYRHRQAVLQFGIPGDSPVHSQLITFLVTGKSLVCSNSNVLVLMYSPLVPVKEKNRGGSRSIQGGHATTL